jgi:hypothetical protein
MPAAVPAETDTSPGIGSNARPVGTVLSGATDRVELAGEAATPLIRSPVKALTTLGWPDAPLMPATLSFAATMGDGSTVTETVAVLQLVGFAVSQI